MSDELLTVAQAAERLGTTIPRLRRLLARPEMAQSSRVVPVPTRRGTRTSTVVPVSELPLLSDTLKASEPNSGSRGQEQERGTTFSRMELSALQTTLRRTEELLASKNQELAAKEEIISLLRAKINDLEHLSASLPELQKQERPFSVPEMNFRVRAVPGNSPIGLGRRPASDRERGRLLVPDEPPKNAWARFYRWFREA